MHINLLGNRAADVQRIKELCISYYSANLCSEYSGSTVMLTDTVSGVHYHSLIYIFSEHH